jgi:hypothetical protein
MSAAAARSPYFDFESQANSPDIGYSANEDVAFAFTPFLRRLNKFRCDQRAACAIMSHDVQVLRVRVTLLYIWV